MATVSRRLGSQAFGSLSNVGLGFRVYRNGIGFGSGVLTESFDRKFRFLFSWFDFGSRLGWGRIEIVYGLGPGF